jgi:hypothetical protein
MIKPKLATFFVFPVSDVELISLFFFVNNAAKIICGMITPYYGKPLIFKNGRKP